MLVNNWNILKKTKYVMYFKQSGHWDKNIKCSHGHNSCFWGTPSHELCSWLFQLITMSIFIFLPLSFCILCYSHFSHCDHKYIYSVTEYVGGPLFHICSASLLIYSSNSLRTQINVLSAQSGVSALHRGIIHVFSSQTGPGLLSPKQTCFICVMLH